MAVICIDFDGTCVGHEFPKVGKDIGAVPVLKRLIRSGHKLVLFTMRSNVKNVKSPEFEGNFTGDYLDDAVNWFKENGIPLYGIQKNPTQSNWTSSPKAYGILYIDDSALGCPLKKDLTISERPFVDWEQAEAELELKGYFTTEVLEK